MALVGLLERLLTYASSDVTAVKCVCGRKREKDREDVSASSSEHHKYTDSGLIQQLLLFKNWSFTGIM